MGLEQTRTGIYGRLSNLYREQRGKAGFPIIVVIGDPAEGRGTIEEEFDRDSGEAYLGLTVARYGIFSTAHVHQDNRVTNLSSHFYAQTWDGVARSDIELPPPDIEKMLEIVSSFAGTA